MKILHLVEHEKFIPPFIDFVNNNLSPEKHHFYFIHNGHQYQSPEFDNVSINIDNRNIVKFLWAFWKETKKSQKIILHGLFSSRVILALVLQPNVLKKCYWIIWGGDLYTYALDKRNIRWKIKEFFRQILIPKIGHLITYIPGDVELARQWYGAKGVYHECLIYPSNTYQPVSLPDYLHHGFNILIGNSADSSNNHEEIISKLKTFDNNLTKIIAPLSYGEKSYAKKITQLGKSIFGEKFVPLVNYIQYKDYLKILADVDIAIFNHKRQQGMGNIISLLGMGKTVAIRSDTSSWNLFMNRGIALRDTLNFEINTLPVDALENNKRIIKEFFSTEVLVNQLKNILED